MELSGCCEYCGQHKVIEVEDGNLTEAEINALVTDQCNCPQAKTERRKAESKQKIEDFIENECAPEARELLRAAVELLRSSQADSVSIQTNDGWKVAVKRNKDYEIVFTCKKSLSKKAVF